MSSPAHASAVSTLVAWEPPAGDQQTLRNDFVRHLARHPDGETRTCRPDHLTASLLVVSDDRRQVLLGLHAKVGRWLQFGGHIEPTDRSLPDAALREGVEESGISSLLLAADTPLRLDRHRAPCGSGARHHLDVQFLATVDRATPATASPESLEVRWFDVAAVPTDTDDAVRALVAAAVSARG
ncbi:MAG: NUDIX domain-containing protein [Actinomycetota bacterium]|nr:NUDIX domain-containing protein [Actinomycetota bacterium]MDH5278177.1 NUDIX domain-containing protein [Actinomycetota bacterium]